MASDRRYMLDTNICSYIMRKPPEPLILRLHQEAQNGSRIVISSIVYAELFYGAINPKAGKALLRKLDTLVATIDSILPLDAAAVAAGAMVQAKLLKAGNQIGFVDSLIAGHALTTNCICVTNNTREFARVESLKIENWILAHQQSDEKPPPPRSSFTP